jgi:2'-hydroxyisoflavone reductase
MQAVSGVFNATGTQLSFATLLDECCRATQSRPQIVWVPTPDLLAAGADPWMAVPLWIAVPGWEAANDVDVTRALAAGLSFRPLAETVRDTLEWDLSRTTREEGLTRDREAELMTAARHGE